MLKIIKSRNKSNHDRNESGQKHLYIYIYIKCDVLCMFALSALLSSISQLPFNYKWNCYSFIVTPGKVQAILTSKNHNTQLYLSSYLASLPASIFVYASFPPFLSDLQTRRLQQKPSGRALRGGWRAGPCW